MFPYDGYKKYHMIFKFKERSLEFYFRCILFKRICGGIKMVSFRLTRVGGNNTKFLNYK